MYIIVYSFDENWKLKQDELLNLSKTETLTTIYIYIYRKTNLKTNYRPNKMN